MWMMWFVMGAAVADTQRPPAPVVEAESRADKAALTKSALRDAWLATDWNYRLATEDRDAVRSEQERVRSDLRDARQAVRGAKKALVDVRRGCTREELVCRA